MKKITTEQIIRSKNWDKLEPQVSIIISNYNYSKFIRDAFYSCIFQDVELPIEIFIIDDCSTDDSNASYIRDMLLTSNVRNRLTCGIFLDKNIGFSAVNNLGMSMSRTPYNVILCGDDYLFPNYVRETFARFQTNCIPNLALVWSLWKGKLSGLSNIIQKGWKKDGLKGGNMIPATTMLKKEAVERVGGWREGLRLHADLDLWLRLAEHYDFYCIEKYLWDYREHNRQKSVSKQGVLGKHLGWVLKNWKTGYEDIWNEQPK